MRTILTSTEIKNIINNIFNDKSETLLITDESGETIEKSFAEYLNIVFYSWKNRLEDKEDEGLLEAWQQSLTVSTNETYCLCEIIDEEVVPSPDIDSATVTGRLTFIVQTDKATNLEYYSKVLRNKFLGVPQEIQNSDGEMLYAYINIGTVLYDEEPQTTQFGETVVVTLNFTVSYLTEALNYQDTQIKLSWDGEPTDDTPIVPFTKATWQNIFDSKPLTKQANPARTGVVNSSVTQAVTLSFYDFNKDFFKKANEVFWKIGAYKTVSGNTTTLINNENPNIPVWASVTTNGTTYFYKFSVVDMQKVITNGDFNISSISVKPWAK